MKFINNVDEMINDLRLFVEELKKTVEVMKSSDLHQFDMVKNRALVNGRMFAIMIGAGMDKDKNGNMKIQGIKSLPTDRQKLEVSKIYEDYKENVLEPVFSDYHPDRLDKNDKVDPVTNMRINYDPKIKEKEFVDLIVRRLNWNLEYNDFLSVNLMAQDISRKNWMMFWGIFAVTIVITATGAIFLMGGKDKKELVEEEVETEQESDDEETWPEDDDSYPDDDDTINVVVDDEEYPDVVIETDYPDAKVA